MQLGAGREDLKWVAPESAISCSQSKGKGTRGEAVCQVCLAAELWRRGLQQQEVGSKRVGFVLGAK